MKMKKIRCGDEEKNKMARRMCQYLKEEGGECRVGRHCPTALFSSTSTLYLSQLNSDEALF